MFNQWWGYVHGNGNIQAKRFFSTEDIHEAKSSPFVLKVFGPFPANNRDEAINNIKEMFYDEDNHTKNPAHHS